VGREHQVAENGLLPRMLKEQQIGPNAANPISSRTPGKGSGGRRRGVRLCLEGIKDMGLTTRILGLLLGGVIVSAIPAGLSAQPSGSASELTISATESTTAAPRELETADCELNEYDPWEPFNEQAFAFNRGFDAHVFKPAARVYDRVLPNWMQHAVGNAFENLGGFRRIVNTTLQGRFNDSGQEVGRLVINTFFGLGGFIDAAPSFGVGKAQADTGQTFGAWGASPGPYLVLPLLQPLTVRDAAGYVFDEALNPLTWVVPFAPSLVASAEHRLNDRSTNLELYDQVEESVVDLYSAVRNGYLQQRRKAINERCADQPHGPRSSEQ
jgi:phospholipid-binding lipoprotein MlaA